MILRSVTPTLFDRNCWAWFLLATGGKVSTILHSIDTLTLSIIIFIFFRIYYDCFAQVTRHHCLTLPIDINVDGVDVSFKHIGHKLDHFHISTDLHWNLLEYFFS